MSKSDAGRRAKLMLVEDDGEFLEFATGILEESYLCVGVSDPEAVVDTCLREDPDAVLLDIDFDGRPLGLDLLTDILAQDPFMPVIMWTDSNDLSDAVTAVRNGAFHYVVKSAGSGAIDVAIESALRHRRALVENAALREEIDRTWGDFIYASNKMEQLFKKVDRIAVERYPVLISGETGVGKGLLAREIHRRSPRRSEAFVPFDCSVHEPSLIGDALFGHVKGSFTGAVKSMPGHFEAAHKGTLFLDEIGDMPMDAQTSLLRLADEHVVTRIGARDGRKVDVRIVAATNRDLSGACGQPPIRHDLLQRLNTFRIHIPPLRERREDIATLARHFCAACAEERQTEHVLSENALRFLRAQEWPGNVRELRHSIERACVLSESPILEPEDFAVTAPSSAIGTYEEAKAKVLLDFKRSYVLEVLRRNSWKVSRAASEAGMSKAGLYRIMKELGLDSKETDD